MLNTRRLISLWLTPQSAEEGNLPLSLSPAKAQWGRDYRVCLCVFVNQARYCRFGVFSHFESIMKSSEVNPTKHTVKNKIQVKCWWNYFCSCVCVCFFPLQWTLVFQPSWTKQSAGGTRLLGRHIGWHQRLSPVMRILMQLTTSRCFSSFQLNKTVPDVVPRVLIDCISSLQSDLWSLGITAIEMAEGAPRM